MSVVLLHSFLTMSVTAGARESGGGERQGGGAEEEVWGEKDTDPQSAGEPEGAAHTAAAAGEWLNDVQYVSISECGNMDGNKNKSLIINTRCLKHFHMLQTLSFLFLKQQQKYIEHKHIVTTQLIWML